MFQICVEKTSQLDTSLFLSTTAEIRVYMTEILAEYDAKSRGKSDKTDERITQEINTAGRNFRAK